MLLIKIGQNKVLEAEDLQGGVTLLTLETSLEVLLLGLEAVSTTSSNNLLAAFITDGDNQVADVVMP